MAVPVGSTKTATRRTPWSWLVAITTRTAAMLALTRPYPMRMLRFWAERVTSMWISLMALMMASAADLSPGTVMATMYEMSVSACRASSAACITASCFTPPEVTAWRSTTSACLQRMAVSASASLQITAIATSVVVVLAMVARPALRWSG